MDQNDLLRHAAQTLDRLNIPYFVTGSFAGILYGEYRMTNDIDIVVLMKPDHVDAFLDAFPPALFYVERDAIVDAIKNRFQFNVIDRDSLAKIDFILPPNSSHDRSALQRARRHRTTTDYDVAYASPEDLLLKKLEFHKQSGSPKHLRDAAGILKKSGPTLDMTYLENWADWLDILPSWRAAKELAASP
jgi:hypothetical protein